MIAAAKPRPQARRTAILDEAIRMLGEHGYNGLTVQALAERCDISNAGLLYYFGSKDELLLAVLDEFELREREIMTPLVERAELMRDDPAAARQAFVALLRTMVRRYAERPDMARFLFVIQTEAIDPTHVAHEWFLERARLALGLFEALVANVSAHPSSTARMLSAHMFGLGQHWIHAGMTFDLLEEWDRAVSLLLPPATKRR